MIQTKTRKEVTLDTQTLSILQIQAEKQCRKLKNYMVQVLKEQANRFEFTDEYKAMMDEMLDKHEKKFDAVKYMRQQREKMSIKLAEMTKAGIIEYFRARKLNSKIRPCA